MKTLDVTRDGHVLLVTMNRPEVLNAYDARMVEELREVWRTFRDDDDLRVAVLTGAGDRSFSTGLDVDDTLASGVASPSLDEDGRVALTSRDLRVFKPIVVAVNGHCCAGGWHFVNDADVILCSENATFFDTHVDVGWPTRSRPSACSAACRSPRSRGWSPAAARTGWARNGPANWAWSTEVVPLEDLVPRALEIAHVMAQHPPEILANSLETIWTAVEDQRARAEALGLALLMRASDRDLLAFRSGAGT